MWDWIVAFLSAVVLSTFVVLLVYLLLPWVIAYG